MKLPEIQAVRDVLAPHYAREFRAYIDRHNQRHPDRQATVKQLCQRFRMTVTDVVYCIEHGNVGLVVSSFAYTAPPEEKKNDWATVMLHGFHPQLAENAPLGQRVVLIFD